MGDITMPMKMKHFCNSPGCSCLTTERYCEKHTKQVQQRYDKQRGSAASRGYDSKWQKARDGYLMHHPLCAECLKQNIYEPATVVDHILAHKCDKELFWGKNNWQSLCAHHHNLKTAKEDGRWGTRQWHT